MTRLTYTLDEISGTATVGSNGGFTFKEEDGIDYAPTTVQLPGGERVPFLFTVKELDAKGTLSQFGGDFTVPSYRGSSFLDPKGRGGSLGRDAAKALPAAGGLHCVQHRQGRRRHRRDCGHLREHPALGHRPGQQGAQGRQD